MNEPSGRRVYTYEEALAATMYQGDIAADARARPQPESANKQDGLGHGGAEDFDDAASHASRHFQQLPWARRWALRLVGKAPFQSLSTIIVLTCIICYQPVVGGLAFLEKEPPTFQCWRAPAGKVPGAWQPCLKEHICHEHLKADEFRPNKSDPQYLDNWVEKFHMLCTPHYKIGLLGSFFFIGVIAMMLVVPAIADSYGRRLPFMVTMAASVAAQSWLMMTSSLDVALGLMIVLGMTFPGKNVVGLAYLLEFTSSNHQEAVVNYYMYLEPILTLYMTFHYSEYSNKYFPLQAIYLCIGIIDLLFIVAFLPESPRYFYSQGQYEQARISLKQVAKFNGAEVVQSESHPFESFLFDAEAAAIEADGDSASQRLMQQQPTAEQVIMGEDGAGSQVGSAQSDSEISVKDYRLNLAKMACMWSAASFNSYLMLFLNKYLEGSIFLNFGLEGFAGLFGACFGSYIYGWLRLRRSFMVSYGITLTFGTLIFAFESGIFNPRLIYMLGFVHESPHLAESIASRDYYLAKLIPYLGFMTKIGINITWQNAYLASFSNPTMFPAAKKATAIGFCNFIARALTICAPLVAELEKPMPSMYLCTIATVALVVSSTFPTAEQELALLEGQPLPEEEDDDDEKEQLKFAKVPATGENRPPAKQLKAE